MELFGDLSSSSSESSSSGALTIFPTSFYNGSNQIQIRDESLENQLTYQGKMNSLSSLTKCLISVQEKLLQLWENGSYKLPGQ